MYYESIKSSIEDEFKFNNLSEELKFKALDLLNKLSENFDKLSTSKANIVAAAIGFFTLATLDKPRNFKQMEDDFGVDAKKLALKAKEIAPFLEIDNHEELIRDGLILNQESKPKARATLTTVKEKENIKIDNEIKKIPEDILKVKRKADNSLEIKDDEFIHLIKEFKDFMVYLFKDKDYIEIKQFIKLLELNMFMAGYEITNTDIEKKFGDLFVYFGFEPKKGREQDKFVNLKDRFGNAEPFSLIKLGE